MTPNISSRIVLSAFGSPATLSANGSTAGSRRSPSARVASSASSLSPAVTLSSRYFTAVGPPRRPQRLVDQLGPLVRRLQLGRARDQRRGALVARRLVAHLGQQLGRLRVGRVASPSTRTSIALESVPMAVSILSSECRPWRSLPALRSASSAGSSDRVDPLLVVGRHGLAQREQRVPVGERRSPAPAPCRHRHLVAGDQRLGDLRPIVGRQRRRSRCPPLPRARCRPSRPPPRRAACGGHRWSASASCSRSGPFCGRLPQLDVVGGRLVAAADEERATATATAASRMTPRRRNAHVRRCYMQGSERQDFGLVCRSGRLRITSRHLMCFSERRARLRRHRRACAAPARPGSRPRRVALLTAARPGGRGAARRAVRRRAVVQRADRRPTWAPSTGTRPRSGWSAASS